VKLFVTGLSGLAIAAIVFGAASTSMTPGPWSAALRSTSTNDAYVNGDVTPISPKISGYVTEVAVRDNQPVKAGDILFRIDDSDYRARVDQANAALDGKRAMLADLNSRLALQGAIVDQAASALQAAEADADFANLEYERVRSLTVDGWASQSRNDQARANDLRSSAKVAEANANLAAARLQTNVLQSQRPRIQADIAAADAALKLARIELENTVVRAPSDGWVGERRARVGQYVRPGTLLIAVVSDDFWVVANFKETQIPAIRTGDAVSISIDGVRSVTFSGLVDSVSPASGAQFALLPPDNATGNFTRIVQRIPVKITLDKGQRGLDRLRPGMSATVALSSAQNGVIAGKVATATRG
jgi:membrane fusion protein (multidrug efflux system)